MTQFPPLTDTRSQAWETEVVNREKTKIRKRMTLIRGAPRTWGSLRGAERGPRGEHVWAVWRWIKRQQNKEMERLVKWGLAVPGLSVKRKQSIFGNVNIILCTVGLGDWIWIVTLSSQSKERLVRRHTDVEACIMHAEGLRWRRREGRK